MSDELTVCAVCGVEMIIVSWKHLLTHNMTTMQYKHLYPMSAIRSPAATRRKQAASAATNASRKGVPRSKETINKIKASKLANPREAWNKGVARTVEQNTQLSNTRKQRFATGEIQHWNTGRTTSADTKHKISQTSLEQHRTYAEISKQARQQTIIAKKLKGWVHSSSLKKGTPSLLTEESREKIRQVARQTNEKRKIQHRHRLYEHLSKHNLTVSGISSDGYIISLVCGTCNTPFTRTASVLTPYRYSMYNGEYCPMCYPPQYPGLYCYKYFVDNPDVKNKLGMLYVVVGKNSNTGEQFIKFGITTRTAHKRLQHESNYDFEVLLQLSMTMYQAYELEQKMLSEFAEVRYTPLLEFGGKTECINMQDMETILTSLDHHLAYYDIPIRIVATGAESH